MRSKTKPKKKRGGKEAPKTAAAMQADVSGAAERAKRDDYEIVRPSDQKIADGSSLIYALVDPRTDQIRYVGRTPRPWK